MHPDDEAEQVWSEEEDDGLSGTALLPESAEVWHDYLSGELSSLWLACKEFLNGHGLPILDNCTYQQFVHFCWAHSSKRIPALD